jgi:predicted enzyme related to lactoylglutathione lyase
MAYEFQVTVDCADPHMTADWWAETLGWRVEPQDEAFIRRMISSGRAADPDGTLRASRVLFQAVPEAKAVKNRVHLDVRIGADDVERAVAALVARGAKVLHGGQQGPYTWVTLADPEGNEFCVSQSAPPGT